jgi:dTDP-glucose 4,6-dehydratase
VRHLLESDPANEVTNLDALTYAGNPDNLADVATHQRYRFVHGDIADGSLVTELVARGGFDAIVNLAAESHVDRSIDDVAPFLSTNVVGTQCLLDAARAARRPRFIQVSTDEVYGTLGPDDAPCRETTPLTPNSPYAASKAGADLLVRAAHHTFGLDAVITRCSNNYGPYQFPEKLIPLFLTNALAGIPVPVYGDGRQVRDWIHVRDHCRGVEAALRRGRAGEVYHFGGRCERSNLDVARMILALCGQPEGLIRHVTDRPGHDRRYAIDCTKAETELGWRPTVSFEEGLAATVAWYLGQAGHSRRTNSVWISCYRKPSKDSPVSSRGALLQGAEECEAAQDDGDIVLAAALEGQVDQGAAGILGDGMAPEQADDLRILDVIGQAIRAEQEAVARNHAVVVDVDVEPRVGAAEAVGQDVAPPPFLGRPFLGDPGVDHALGQGVVPRQAAEMAVAVQINPRVAGMHHEELRTGDVADRQGRA